MNSIKKFRDHVSTNRRIYIALGVGAAVGASITCGFIYGRSVVINDSLNVSVNSPKTNVVIQMVRPGPKSYAIQCLESQEVYPSIRQAARTLGINASDISRHLKGEISEVHGLHFDKQAEL